MYVSARGDACEKPVLDTTANVNGSRGVGPGRERGARFRALGAAAGIVLDQLRRAGAAVAWSGERTGGFFVRAWAILRTEKLAALRHVWQFFVAQSFSSLTRRIVFLNVAGLLAFVLGILYLTQFRAGLIDARLQSLIVQGDLIAIAIAGQATESDAINIDPERLLECRRAKASCPPTTRCSASNFPSIRNGWRRCCAG